MNIEYKFETHCHTSEVSPCGNVDAKKIVGMYIEANYSGIVITDHFCKHTFSEIGNLPWKEVVEYYLTGWKTAKDTAKNDLTVLLGMELTFYENANDYLVYGVTEQILLENKNILEMGIRTFSKIAKENGLIIFQAHPFRNGMTIINPEFLNGVEVFNANIRHDSRNEIAEDWANKYALKKSSGSDFHELADVARGGIITQKKIENNDDLISVLLENPKLIRNLPSSEQKL